MRMMMNLVIWIVMVMRMVMVMRIRMGRLVANQQAVSKRTKFGSVFDHEILLAKFLYLWPK